MRGGFNFYRNAARFFGTHIFQMQPATALRLSTGLRLDKTFGYISKVQNAIPALLDWSA